MRKLSADMLRHKLDGPRNEVTGAYRYDHYKIKNYYFQIVASIGEGWEHASTTLRLGNNGKFVERTPTWSEMAYVKNLFWNEDETVIQFHPPKSEHVNLHPYCLHLWKPTGIEILLPDSLLVGVNIPNPDKYLKDFNRKL